MNGSPIKRPAVRREPSTPRKIVKTSNPNGLLTPDATPEKLNFYKAGVSAGASESPGSTPDSISIDSPSTPVKLFNSASPISPSPADSPAPESAYFKGKALFQRGSKFQGVVGRQDEKNLITSKLEHSIKHHTSGALYVSGLPGTGKSASVSEILQKLVKTHKKIGEIEIAKINCMTIDKPDQTYSVIAKEFEYIDRRSRMSPRDCYDLLQKEFKRNDTTHILVLDELDRIVTTNQEILFRIFEWSCGTGTNLVVIGIANAIDLTDRFLPRLQAHKLKPEVVAFKPYTAQGITQIIEARLALLPKKLMHPAAVRICAAKTAANSGDLRKAFDVCRRAIEVVEEEEAKKCIDGESNANADGGIVTTRHVAKVCQAVFAGVDPSERLRNLNFQQQAVLCVLLKTERNSNVPNITVIQAFQEYEHRCTQNPVINSLSYSEYVEVVNALEANGLLAVTGLCGKKGLGSQNSSHKTRGGYGSANSNEGYRDEFGQRKISSRAQILDVLSDLSDNDPLRSILID